MIGSVCALDNLEQLDRDLLYLFVIGPGRGEGLAIALPGGGWVVVDGCRLPRRVSGRPGALPLMDVYSRWSRDDDPVTTFVLTHPHDDHVDGVPEIIERLDPACIGVTGTDEPVKTLVDLAEMMADEAKRTPASHSLPARRVRQAIQAINTWHERHPAGLVSLHQGGTLPVALDPSDDTVTVTVHAPEPEFVRDVWSRNADDRANFLTDKPNWLSTVLELRFDAAKIILGGDLPRTDHGAVVPTGWDQVMDRVPELADHVGLKIPHHGSREAIHEGLLSPGKGNPRAWLLTPFNSSRLPVPDDKDGLELLLTYGAPIHQTALSWSRALCQACEKQRITRGELCADLAETVGRGTFKPTDTVLRRVEHYEPLDPVWAVAVSATGEVVGRWYGRAAFEIHP